MPQYIYECSQNHPNEGCGHLFEEILNVDDRMVPMGEPCPKCKKEGNITRQVGRECPNLCGLRSALGINVGGKMDQNVRKEIDRIKDENPSMITKILD